MSGSVWLLDRLEGVVLVALTDRERLDLRMNGTITRFWVLNEESKLRHKHAHIYLFLSTVDSSYDSLPYVPAASGVLTVTCNCELK